jgi:hypothetical protein
VLCLEGYAYPPRGAAATLVNEGTPCVAFTPEVAVVWTTPSPSAVMVFAMADENPGGVTVSVATAARAATQRRAPETVTTFARVRALADAAARGGRSDVVSTA